MTAKEALACRGCPEARNCGLKYAWLTRQVSGQPSQLDPLQILQALLAFAWQLAICLTSVCSFAHLANRFRHSCQQWLDDAGGH